MLAETALTRDLPGSCILGIQRLSGCGLVQVGSDWYYAVVLRNINKTKTMKLKKKSAFCKGTRNQGPPRLIHTGFPAFEWLWFGPGSDVCSYYNLSIFIQNYFMHCL